MLIILLKDFSLAATQLNPHSHFEQTDPKNKQKINPRTPESTLLSGKVLANSVCVFICDIDVASNSRLPQYLPVLNMFIVQPLWGIILWVRDKKPNVFLS